MNKKLGKVAAIALSAAMISSAFAMSTSASFAAVPTYKGTATAVLTDADANKYLDTTASTAAGEITVSRTDAAVGTANTAFSGATFKDSDAATVTASTYDYTNVTIQNDGGGSVTLAQPENGTYQFKPASAGKTKFKVSNLKITTTNDETYLVAPFDFTVDAENKDTYAEGIWYNSADKPVTSATVNDKLTVKERTITTSQDGTAFAATTDTAANLPAQTVANATVDDSANTVTPTSAGMVTVSYASTKFANTYRNSDPLTVKAQSTYKNVTKVTKLTNGKYHVTFVSGDPKDFDSLTGITLQADTTGITVDKDVAADTIDGVGKDVTVNPGATVNKIAQTMGAVTIDSATVKTVSASGAAPVTVKASTAGDAANVDAITTTGTVGVGDAGDAATVNVGSITAGGKVTVTAGTKDYSKTTVKSIKADNVDVNSAKTSIGAITENATAGKVTTTVDGVSLPALTGYELDAQGNTTVASIDAATKDVKITNDKTLTVTGTAKVNHINGAGDDTAAVLAATTGTIKIGADKLTLAPEAGSAAHLNNFKLVLTDSAAAYGKAFELSAGASADSSTAANDTSVGAGDLADITIAGATGYVASGDKTVTLGEKVDEAALNDASPAASKVDASHHVTVKAGTPITLAVEPAPLKTLPAGYYVRWTSTNSNDTSNNPAPGYVTLGSTTGLSTTVTASYSDVDTYKNTNWVTATLYKTGDSATHGSITYKVIAEKSAAAETTDFTATAPTVAIKTGATNANVTFAPNGSEALGTVTYVSSSNPLVATSADATDGKTAAITAHKAGTADLTFSWTNSATGEVKTHVVTVYVADHPVVAYVNGKVANPNDTLSFTQSTTVPITFVSADGTKFDTFNYNAGNGKIMSTRAPASTVWNGVSGKYGMYMNGPVGSATGVYVNNQKICSVKVADRPFTCDTTYNFNLKAGKTYEFKLTPAAGTTFDNFTFNTAKDAALSTNGYKKNADGTINAFVKAVQKGTYGVYVTINDVQYKVFAVTVD